MEEAARGLQSKAGEGGKNRLDRLATEITKAERELADLDANARDKDSKDVAKLARQNFDDLKGKYDTQREAAYQMKQGQFRNTQQGTLGVNLSVSNERLRNQQQVGQSATRWLGSRNAIEVGGIWIDEAFCAEHKTVAVKAMSPAYFRILERHPEAKNIFRISNHLVWVTPSQVAIVIDPLAGAEEMADQAIDDLFRVVAPAKK